MSIAITSFHDAPTSRSSFTLPVTVPLADNRRVVFAFVRESAATISTAPTFNGQAMTLRVDADHSTSTVAKFDIWDYEVPSGLEAGTYNITLATGTGVLASLFAWHLTNVLPGAPFSIAPFGQTASGTAWSCSVDTPANGALLALSMGVSNSLTITLDSNANVTERLNNNAQGFYVTYGDAVNTSAATRTINSTSATSTTARLVGALSYALAPAANPVYYRRLSGITTFY